MRKRADARRTESRCKADRERLLERDTKWQAKIWYVCKIWTGRQRERDCKNENEERGTQEVLYVNDQQRQGQRERETEKALSTEGSSSPNLLIPFSFFLDFRFSRLRSTIGFAAILKRTGRAINAKNRCVRLTRGFNICLFSILYQRHPVAYSLFASSFPTHSFCFS